MPRGWDHTGWVGTYYPPGDRYGRPGFPRVLRLLAEAWRERRDEVEQSANELTGHIDRKVVGEDRGVPDRELQGRAPG